MSVDKNQELTNVLVVRLSGVGETLISSLSGLVSGEHLWLKSVNECQFIAHVPLDDEQIRIEIRSIEGSILESLRDEKCSPSAIFDTTIPKASKKGNQRYLALLFSSSSK